MAYKYTQWFPYQNVQTAYNTNALLPLLPRQICDYLIDAPQGDYQPPDDNNFCRTRLWKYLYYDEAQPLNNPLPTIQQKMSVVYNSERSETPPTDKGYRLIPQIWIKESQTVAQTRVFVFLGRAIPVDDFKTAVAVHFRIWCHYNYETNTKTSVYDRAIGIEQAILESLNGVNISGIGTFQFNRQVHPDCQGTMIYDKNSNIGRELVIALVFGTTDTNSPTSLENSVEISPSIKLW